MVTGVCRVAVVMVAVVLAWVSGAGAAQVVNCPPGGRVDVPAGSSVIIIVNNVDTNNAVSVTASILNAAQVNNRPVSNSHTDEFDIAAGGSDVISVAAASGPAATMASVSIHCLSGKTGGTITDTGTIVDNVVTGNLIDATMNVQGNYDPPVTDDRGFAPSEDFLPDDYDPLSAGPYEDLDIDELIDEEKKLSEKVDDAREKWSKASDETDQARDELNRFNNDPNNASRDDYAAEKKRLEDNLKFAEDLEKDALSAAASVERDRGEAREELAGRGYREYDDDGSGGDEYINYYYAQPSLGAAARMLDQSFPATSPHGPLPRIFSFVSPEATRPDGFGYWLQGSISGTDVDRPGASRSGDTYKLNAGIEKRINRSFTLGASLRYQHTESNSTDLSADINADLVGGALFARLLLTQQVDVTLLAAFEHAGNEVTIGGATGRFDYDSWIASAKLSRRFALDNGWWITPDATLTFSTTDREGYTGSASNAIPRATINMGLLQFGPTIGKTFRTDPGSPLAQSGIIAFAPTFSISGTWFFDHPDDAVLSNSTVLPVPDSGVTYTGGVNLTHANGLTSNLSGSFTRMSDDGMSWSVSGGLTLPLNIFSQTAFGFKNGAYINDQAKLNLNLATTSSDPLSARLKLAVQF